MKNYIWVERLRCADIFALSLRSLISDCEIYYDENRITRTAQASLSLLNRLSFCKNFHFARLKFDKKDENGLAISYRMQHDLNSCITEFFKRNALSETELFVGTARAYVSLYLFNRMAFISMVESKDEFKRCGAGPKNILRVASHPVNKVIFSFYRERGYVIEESVLSFEYAKYYLRPVYYAARMLFARILSVNPKNNINDIKPSIWVENVHSSIVDFAFWKEAVDTKEFDIVKYMDRPENVRFGEVTKKIESQGLKWIDLRNSALFNAARLRFSDIREAASRFFRWQNALPFWFRVYEFEFFMKARLYGSVFRKFNVKVIVQHQETSWVQGPQAVAIENSGGIMAGFNWSGYLYHEESFMLTPQHVYFAWGKIVYDCMKKRGHSCRYILPSGISGFTDEKSEDARGEAVFKDAEFVMAIFDSTVTYNIYQTEEELANFYMMVLGLLEDRPSWRGIIKSKYLDMGTFRTLPRGDEITGKIEDLIGKKRLVLFDPASSPLSAAECADLSVCFSLNSAGVIAGVYGNRAIHWDCSGWLLNPIYKDKKQKIVFTSPDMFQKAIIDSAAGDSTIGDFHYWEKHFNYFCDFEAPRRVGSFIRSFMKDVTFTHDAARSLDAVAKNYLAENKVGEDFSAEDNLWDEKQPLEAVREACNIAGHR